MAQTKPCIISLACFALVRNRKGQKYKQERVYFSFQEHRDSYDKNDIRDIIDLQFAEVEKRETSGRVDDRFEKDSFDDVAMRGSVFDLFVGGTETTSTTLLWLMMLMALHPNIQRKVTMNNFISTKFIVVPFVVKMYQISI